MTPNAPRVVVPSTTKRDALIAVVAGSLILVFVVYGIMQMGAKPPSNELTGIVMEKSFTPQKERRIDFSGRKIQRTLEIDGEYVLKVRVERENRVYEVPVEKPVYEAKKAGDAVTFLRPESEQR